MKRTAMPQRRAGLARSSRLPYRSRKTADLYRKVRVPLVVQLLDETPRCEVPACWRKPTVLHEVVRRSQGGSITDRANIRVICDPCHEEITFRPRPWMYALGFLKRRGGGVPVVKIPHTSLCEFCVLTGKTHCDPCRFQGARVVTVNAGELP